MNFPGLSLLSAQTNGGGCCRNSKRKGETMNKRALKHWAGMIAVSACLIGVSGCRIRNGRHFNIGSQGIYYGQRTSGILNFLWGDACKRDRACLKSIINNTDWWGGDEPGMGSLKIGANDDHNFYNALDDLGSINTTKCLVLYVTPFGGGFTTQPNGGSCVVGSYPTEP
jgi:hypothetical protein